MNLAYRHLLPAEFPAESRTWIFQASRRYGIAEALQIEAEIENFLAGWNSHGAPVRGFGSLFFGQFLVLMAEQSQVQVSGCSTDSAIHFVQNLEKKLGVTLFDRQHLAFVNKDKIELIPLPQIPHAYRHGFIQDETLFFDNTVQTKAGMESSWILPVAKSWLAKRLQISPSNVSAS